jgi:primosomal protein N' (replication factor Y)
MTAQDMERTEKLEHAGYRVLRFWNPDVLRNIDGVVEMVVHAVGAPADGV